MSMFSNVLIQQIETHWDAIAAGTVRRIRREADVPHMQRLSEAELLNWAHGILETLKSWECSGEEEALAVEYNDLGRLRFENAVPLHEVIRCLHILKLRVSGFVRDHAFAQNALEIYAQLELEYRLGLFFDWLLYNVALGYEEARRRAAFVNS